jgi:hypothetical protein
MLGLWIVMLGWELWTGPLSGPLSGRNRAWRGAGSAVTCGQHGPTAPVDVEGAWTVEVASTGEGEGEGWSGVVGADAALLLRPA